MSEVTRRTYVSYKVQHEWPTFIISGHWRAITPFIIGKVKLNVGHYQARRKRAGSKFMSRRETLDLNYCFTSLREKIGLKLQFIMATLSFNVIINYYSKCSMKIPAELRFLTIRLNPFPPVPLKMKMSSMHWIVQILITSKRYSV